MIRDILVKVLIALAIGTVAGTAMTEKIVQEKYYTTQRQTNLYNYTILHDCKHLYMTTLYYQTVNMSTWLYYTTQIKTYLYDYTIL